MNLHNSLLLLSGSSKKLNIHAKCFSQLRQPQLVEVGKLEKPLKSGNYKTGQLFIHKLFGYRGIILFPWIARMHDRNLETQFKSDSEHQLSDWSKPGHDSEGKLETFYNILIDDRDIPYIRITAMDYYMDTKLDLYLDSLGVDYVWHRDLIPYTASVGEEPPLRHRLLSQLTARQFGQNPPFAGKDTLSAWRAKNRPWLQSTEVYKQTTDFVQVTVMPFYMGLQGSGIHLWRYLVSLASMGGVDEAQVTERRWRVLSDGGTLQRSRDRGIDGEPQLLTRAAPALQYSSHVGLTSSSGHMWGAFTIRLKDGSEFECRVPPIPLVSSSSDNISQSDI